MKTRLLKAKQVLKAYDRVAALYPNVPPLSMWRAWEYAAYRNYNLLEPVLDVGCGDGQYFRLVWPKISKVIGVDHDLKTVIAAGKSGVYESVCASSAAELPFENHTFKSAFANCSLEHMDKLPQVLMSVERTLIPGGIFLLSVVTDKLIEWATLPDLFDLCGADLNAIDIKASYIKYHHLMNPLAPLNWHKALMDAGFEVLEHIPIVPEITSRLFLMLDYIWHIERDGNEFGSKLHSYMSTIKNFDKKFRDILKSVISMEIIPEIGSGAILYARKFE